MNSDSKLVPKTSGDIVPTHNEYNFNSGVHTFINQANNVILGGSLPEDIPFWGVSDEIDCSAFNLFVVSEEDTDGKSITVPKQESLKDTEEHLSKEVFALGEPELKKTWNRLALLVTKESHQGYLCIICGIAVKESSVRVLLQPSNIRFSTDVLLEYANSFGIKCASAVTELDRTHWAIKSGNLTELLAAAGVETRTFNQWLRITRGC